MLFTGNNHTLVTAQWGRAEAHLGALTSFSLPNLKSDTEAPATTSA